MTALQVFENLNNLYTQPQEVAAIWLNFPAKTNLGYRCRLAPEMTICIENGIIADGELNKRIVSCSGTLVDQFKLTVVDLKNNQTEIINI